MLLYTSRAQLALERSAFARGSSDVYGAIPPDGHRKRHLPHVLWAVARTSRFRAPMPIVPQEFAHPKVMVIGEVSQIYRLV